MPPGETSPGAAAAARTLSPPQPAAPHFGSSRGLLAAAAAVGIAFFSIGMLQLFRPQWKHQQHPPTGYTGGGWALHLPHTPPRPAVGTPFTIFLTLSPLERSDSGPLPRLWFECRLPGPVLVVCALELKRGRRGYELSATLPVPGDYRLRLVLAHVGNAYPEAPTLIPQQFEGTELQPSHAPLVITAHRLAGRAPERLPPCSAAVPPTPGHYALTPQGEIGPWQPQNCKALPPVDVHRLGDCLQRSRLLLVGDSHTRGWHEVLSAALGRAVHGDGVMAPSLGLTGKELESAEGGPRYLRVEGIEQTPLPNASRIPPELAGGMRHTAAQMQSLKALLQTASTPAPAAPGASGRHSERHVRAVVGMNLGSWDLRDVPSSLYCARLNRLLDHMRELGLNQIPGVRWIWRLTPAYSYNAKKFRDRDYRTNEQIARANDCAVQTLRQKNIGVHWEVHDSYAFTRPVFRSACDSHHYLCPWPPRGPNGTALPTGDRAATCPLRSAEGTAVSTGCAGAADIAAFLHRACRPAR
eukprot:TRINITY_DN20635_c0_g1_i1.p1 TRINITY_DN20635_c0_g1~~TRINITY_DN20635_c0_g1_i1.p1  ORF type:complete len:526 (+),score=77.36 TRINITY_DN20635_c0_g1_i1:143-1720(+)